jgi:hypothetical protein
MHGTVADCAPPPALAGAGTGAGTLSGKRVIARRRVGFVPKIPDHFSEHFILDRVVRVGLPVPRCVRAPPPLTSCPCLPARLLPARLPACPPVCLPEPATSAVLRHACVRRRDRQEIAIAAERTEHPVHVFFPLTKGVLVNVINALNRAVMHRLLPQQLSAPKEGLSRQELDEQLEMRCKYLGSLSRRRPALLCFSAHSLLAARVGALLQNICQLDALPDARHLAVAWVEGEKMAQEVRPASLLAMARHAPAAAVCAAVL